MANWPEVTVQICTYNRYDDIRKTVEALVENLTYPNLKWVICDDNSPGTYISRLKRLKLFKDLNAKFISTLQNGGWGVNVNNGLRNIPSPYVFFCEDDYVLEHPLDLRFGVAIMETKPHIGMMRYRGTAGDTVVFHQQEADIRPWLPDYHMGGGVIGRETYLLLDGGSPSLWLYSNGPHLKRRSFHDFYGYYSEGLKLGQTEEHFCHVVKEKMKIPDAPCIAILPDWIRMWWAHIGTSYQGTEFDT